MQNYPVRTTHRAGLVPDALLELVRTSFGTAERSGEDVTGSFGAIERLTVRGGKRELLVETVMNPKVSTDVAAETVKRYNHFLEAATGYTSKERARRLRKSASAPSE